MPAMKAATMVHLDRLRAIARMLAVPGAMPEAIVLQVQSAFGKRTRGGNVTELPRREALALIAEAKEYLSSDSACTIEFSKQRYCLALEEFIGLVRGHMVKKVVKRIVETEPEEPDTKKPAKDGQAQKMRVKVIRTEEVDVFDSRAAELVLRSMKELAILSGARPSKEVGRLPGNNVQVNVPILVPGAARTKQMGTEELVRSLFGDGQTFIEGQLVQGSEGTADAGPPGLPEGAGDGDEQE